MPNKKQCSEGDQTHQGSIVSFSDGVGSWKKYSGTSANFQLALGNFADCRTKLSDTGEPLKCPLSQAFLRDLSK
ncbi:Neutral ceramidase [Fusarium oxysporum f. sp. albedinis]|nr:Neutral ceramidase [Fusarium oxysporum f. sp. albedinis]